MTKKELTRKPSEEMVWTKFYAPGCEDILKKEMPQITLWKYMEEKMLKDGDQYDAIHYFGNRIKRSELIKEVHTCAKIMKNMGVKPGDEVVLFAPAFPEAIYVLFAANMIGATTIMPYLFSAKNLEKESMRKARVAFVYIGMEDRMDEALTDTQFEHVVLMDVTRSMGFPTKQIATTATYLKNLKIRHKNPKYITMSEAVKRYGHYEGQLEAPAVKDQVAMVFASSGTTLVSTSKQIAMTNEAILNMFRDTEAFNLNTNLLHAGYLSYCYLPPFAATAFYILMMGPLYYNMTIHMDPRLSLELFTEAILKYRPQVTLVPGRLWEGFFTEVEKMIAAGKRPDLSNLKFAIMGGEGCTPEALRWMDGLMRECGCTTSLVSGYGMTEVFSVATVDTVYTQKARTYDRDLISVGIPFPGVTVGVFDKDGNELSYGERGELWIKSPSMGKGYYCNKELTREIFRDGWVHSCDLAEIDEDGMVYLYGRMKQHVDAPNGEPVYLFDIGNEIRRDPAIKDVMGGIINGDMKNPHVVAHLLMEDNCQDSELDVLTRVDKRMQEWLPKGFKIEGYKLHTGLFVSRPTGKVDHMYYERQLDGYKLPVDGKLQDVSFRGIVK